MDDFSEDTCAWVEINVACPKFRWVLNRRIFHSNFGAGSHLERFYTWEGIYLFHCGVSSAKAYGHLLRDIRVRRHLDVFFAGQDVETRCAHSALLALAVSWAWWNQFWKPTRKELTHASLLAGWTRMEWLGLSDPWISIDTCFVRSTRLYSLDSGPEYGPTFATVHLHKSRLWGRGFWIPKASIYAPLWRGDDAGYFALANWGMLFLQTENMPQYWKLWNSYAWWLGLQGANDAMEYPKVS